MTSSSTSNVNNREADLNFRLQATSKAFLNSRISFLSFCGDFGGLFMSWSLRKLDVHRRKLLRQVVEPD